MKIFIGTLFGIFLAHAVLSLTGCDSTAATETIEADAGTPAPERIVVDSGAGTDVTLAIDSTPLVVTDIEISSNPDAGRAYIPGDCHKYMFLFNGQTNVITEVPTKEGEVCRTTVTANDGTCRAGGCCTGCWTGTTCISGTVDGACGQGGQKCFTAPDDNPWDCRAVAANDHSTGCTPGVEASCRGSACNFSDVYVCCPGGTAPSSGKCRRPNK